MIEGPERHIVPVLNHVARVSARACDAALAPTGLRPRHLVALMLLQDHGPSSQQGLVDTLSLDPSNVVVLLNDLEDRGLITRRRDPADRRRHIVDISPVGREKLLAAQQRLSRAEDHLLSALTAQERVTLHDLLTRAAGGQLSASTCAKEDGPPVKDCPQIA